MDMSVNIAVASPLLSRFDVVFVLLDDQQEAWDRLVSGFILNERTKSRDPSVVDYDDNTADDHGGGGHQKSTTMEHTEIGNVWTMKHLQAYIYHIRATFHPAMTRAAESILVTYYQMQRSLQTRNMGRTTLRLLESMIRLAQAHARLMWRHKVLICDAIIAVSITEASMQRDALLGSTDLLHTKFPDDADEEYARQGLPSWTSSSYMHWPTIRAAIIVRYNIDTLETSFYYSIHTHNSCG